jgi:CRISPR-associated exonuclease Cas4
MIFLIAGLVLALIAAILLISAGRRQRAAGLPPGRVIYSDMRGWQPTEKPLFDPLHAIAGKPDYLVEQNGRTIPVEVKSGWARELPHESHVFQLAAYCRLVEYSTGKRPPYGILRYRNRTFAVDYTPELEQRLIDLLVEMRQQARQGSGDRSHEEPARCARCGFRSICDQRLS